MVLRNLRHADHTWVVLLEAAPTSGWHLIEQRDAQVVRRRACTDWHRVERVLILLDQTAAVLQQRGWVVNPDPS